MFNLFMPEEPGDIEIVTVSCPKCPRKFKTLAPIARSEEPHCPDCDVPMEVARAARV